MSEQLPLSYNPLLSTLPALSLKKDVSTKAELMAKGLEIFDFTVGDPKEPTPPFILEALHSGITDVSQYPSTTGSSALLTAATQWIQRRFNVSVDTQTQIISSNGSKEAVFHVPQILLNLATEKNIIVFPEPAYPIYNTGTILAGGRVCKIPLKPSANYVFDINDIPQEKMNQIAALWVCYPHNPTGAVISYKEAEKIYSWALENNIILLSDECYADMYFEGEEPPISFLQIAQKNNFKNLLTFFSLSKRSGMTGYRSGTIVGDANLIELYTKYRFNVGLGTPDFIQNAAVAAWNDDDHVKDRNRIFYQKRELVVEFLKQNQINFLSNRATFYMWISVPEKYESAQEYCGELKKIGIFVTPGHAFGESCKSYFRLALVPTCEKIKEALQVWQSAINSNMI